MLRSLILSVLLAAAAFGLDRLDDALAANPPVMTAAPGEVLFAAGFDALAEDWEIFDDGELSARVVADDPATAGIRLRAEKAGVAVPSAARWHVADFDYTVMAAAVGGPVDNGYGVVFRYRDPRNTYAFHISSDGYYSIERTLNGQSERLSAWIASDVVNPGIGAVNTLRVVGVGDSFRFWVNGESVMLCIPDDSAATSTYAGGQCVGGQMRDSLSDAAFPTGRLGVTVITPGGADVEAAFDNVVVRAPVGEE